MKVALIDYGAGNLTSVKKALTFIGVDVNTPPSPSELAEAVAIVVPGVGHFQATAALDERWRAAVVSAVDAGRPLLGICLGMQWLFDGSEEAPAIPGLGFMSGRCAHLGRGALGPSPNPESQIPNPVKVPHVGWNALCVTGPSRVLGGIADGAHVYFTHSYAAPVGPDCVATTTHGETFAAAVERGHVCGVQFHPEKSGEVGLQILRNFVSMAR